MSNQALPKCTNKGVFTKERGCALSTVVLVPSQYLLKARMKEIDGVVIMSNLWCILLIVYETKKGSCVGPYLTRLSAPLCRHPKEPFFNWVSVGLIQL